MLLIETYNVKINKTSHREYRQSELRKTLMEQIRHRQQTSHRGQKTQTKQTTQIQIADGLQKIEDANRADDLGIDNRQAIKNADRASHGRRRQSKPWRIQTEQATKNTDGADKA